MKRRLHCVLAAVVCAACAGLLSAADTSSKPALSFVYVHHVKPSMMQQYETAVKEFIGELRAYEIDPTKVNFWTVSGPELGYAYVVPLENFAAMDTMREDYRAAIEKLGKERWETLSNAINTTVERRESFHAVRRADLSYTPEEPALNPDDVGDISYHFYYAIPGHEKQMEEVARKYADLYKSHGIGYGWSVYQAVTGADLPVYVVAQPHKSMQEFHAVTTEIAATLGEAGERLGQIAMSHARKLEMKDGWPRRELSYTPNE